MRSAAIFSRTIGFIGIVAAALAAPAEPELGHPFEMRPAEAVTIQRVRITFENVFDDSRCPAGASCIWAGDAAAAFTLETPSSAALHRTLHTNGRFERETEYDGLVVRLEGIKPYPKEGATIRPDDYRATLVVTKRQASGAKVFAPRAMTVSGLTMTSAVRHPLQIREGGPQNHRSVIESRNCRGRVRWD